MPVRPLMEQHEQTAQLCDFCRNINFEALRTPLVSDIPALKQGTVDTTRHPFKVKNEQESVTKSTYLGTLGALLQRAATGNCRLCYLFGKVLAHHGAHWHLERRPERHCFASPNYHGQFWAKSSESAFVTTRLSLTTDAAIPYPVGHDAQKDGPYYVEGLYFAIQACNTDATSVRVDERFVDPRPGVDMMIYGGRRRELVLDLGWVRRWIAICQDRHGVGCEEHDVDPGHRFERVRFIDVKQRCIVTLADTCLSDHRYVALSYVWGGPQAVKLELSNIEQLAKQDALRAGALPQTLDDAILLTDSLGFQYLWVDALCIIQDDDGDKKMQIGGMSQIYGCAFLTVIAASAGSVDGGLPGLRPGTRSQEQEEIMVIAPQNEDKQSGSKIRPGLSLMTTLQPLTNRGSHLLEDAVWNSRGWTLQERVLSRRVLIFMHEQVYWICRQGIFCEESYFEHEAMPFKRFSTNAAELMLRRPARSSHEAPDDEDRRFWANYKTLVVSYSRRTFAYPGDVADGFLAILQGLSRLSGEEFTWGLPRSHFEQGLFWNTFAGVRRRESLSTLPMTSMQRRVQFPSWSWMGWLGEVTINIGDERFEPDFDAEIPEILCFEHHHHPLRLERVRRTAAAYDWLRQQDLPSWKAGHDQPVELADLTSSLPQLPDIPETLVLFFWTSSAFFTVVTNHGTPAPSLVNTSGDVVGSVKPMPPEDDHRTSEGQRLGQHEFIVIGSSRSTYPGAEPVLLVLQIEWRQGIAYRVNFGEVKERFWEAVPHTWKLIALG
ncbi:hypothetical protein VTI74DRAFT_1702 [Chaetomium olivicolor]